MSKIKCKIIVCDLVRTDMAATGVQNSIVNYLAQLEPISIPGNFTFTVVCVFSGDYREMQSSYFTVKLIDPNNKIVSLFENIPFPVIPQNDVKMPLNNIQSFQINCEFRNVVLSCEGEYKIDVSIGAELISSETIEVRKRDLSGIVF